jgi:hypothetical protein
MLPEKSFAVEAGDRCRGMFSHLIERKTVAAIAGDERS